jgi:hypothetical protein
MSSQARPISPTSFAVAIADLPVSSLYAKASELANSIAHLRVSNAQLDEFAQAGDRDCAEALAENVETLDRMLVRVELLRYEVEVVRGMRWEGDTVGGAKKEEEKKKVGLSDQEVARRMEDRLREDDEAEAEESGVYL